MKGISFSFTVKKINFFSGILVCLILLLGLSNSVNAQLTVVEGAAMNMTPQQLIQNKLIGQGVTISNATFNGTSTQITSNQVGTFSTTGTATSQLGLRGGILMTTGKASLAKGPNNATGAGLEVGGPGDPDLTIISGKPTYDRAALEFDFVPKFDTIRFRYVFGSEEFFEFCYQFNDAFGFFLSGPGITGTFSNNAINIALMPGSITNYVTINNICSNTASRWENATGGVNYQYDGLTHVFTSWHIVQPCSTYHIKLAIADAMDKKLDSGVFLEENSFGSPGVTMIESNSVPLLGNRALEGCNDVIVSFKLTQNVDYAYRVNLTITGTAVNGVDYTAIPNFIIFPPGSDSVAIKIHPKWDTIPEGPKSVILKIDQISCTGAVERDTVWIDDYTPLKIKPEPDSTICHGESITLQAEVSGGLRPFTYLWNVTPGTDSIITLVPPVGINSYIVRVTDLCRLSQHDTTIITVHPAPIANAGSDIAIPNGTNTTLNGSASGGYGSYSFSWTSNPPWFTSSIPNPNTGNLSNTTIFLLIATDLQSGCQSEQSQVIVAVEGGPLSVNPVAEPDTICYGSPAHLYALAGGGSGLYTYSWSSIPPGFSSTLSDMEVIGTENTTYTVVANDGYNQRSGSTSLVVNPLPVIHLGPTDSTVCIYDSVRLDATNSGSTYEWSNGATTKYITISSTGIGYEVQTYTVWVTNENLCKDSATINVYFSFNACVGVDEKSDNMDFRVYPNPSNGMFKILMNPARTNLEIEIFNLLGVRVYYESITATIGHPLEKTLDVSFLPSGLYTLRLSGENFAGSQKIRIK
jgi:hypothetical protein